MSSIGLVINTYEQRDASEVVVTPQCENVPSIFQYFVILRPLQSTSRGLGKGLFNYPLLNNGRVHLVDGPAYKSGKLRVKWSTKGQIHGLVQ